MTAAQPRERIGPYRIVARVGAGGMGEVFKAWDPRLERDVAIKLLHPEMAMDSDRQQRLLAEGRAASALNHPNILRVYDADVDGSSYYLVSEWLEGKSLRDELSRGPLPLKRLLDLAVQIADGLAAAHAIGIVHRDIKPENIMLARDGTARIVDFGLARSDPHAPAMAAVVGQAATVTASLDGGISGTPAYMSPEQARGTVSDFRTDQFSFGALLYEMATGKYAFRRESTADTLSAVLHDEPKPIADLNRRVPAACRWIIEQCLAKDAHERYAATEDLARELRRVRDRLNEAIADPIALDAPRSSHARRWAPVLVSVAALITGALIVLPIRPVAARLEFTPLASASAYEGTPAWSADGNSVAYVVDVDGVLQVFVKRVGDSSVSHQVTRMRFDAEHPFWAPDSRLLYFISLAGEHEALWSVSVAGGTPELVLENVMLAAIDRQGARLALLRSMESAAFRSALWWSSPPGAAPVKEQRPPFDRLESTAGQLNFSGDGQLLVWMAGVGGGNDSSFPRNSFFLFPAGDASPRRVLAHVPRAMNLPPFGWLSDNQHVMLALPDERLGNRHLWLADTRSDALRQITATHTNETSPALSAAGGQVAYATDDVDFDLVHVSADGRKLTSVLATARNEFAPVWSPAGDQFAFVTDRSGALEIWARSRDGQWERPIVTAGDFDASKTESFGSLMYSPDGRSIAFQRSDGINFAIWVSPSTGGKPVRLVPASEGVRDVYQDAPSWSPDSNWVCYIETDSGSQRQSLRKIRFGSKDSLLLADEVVSFSPTRWSPDGRWVLVQLDAGLARIPADSGKPQVIVDEAFIDFAWAPDSRHVFVLAESETAGHFGLSDIDSTTGRSTILNPDLGPIPIANQPIRGFSFLPGEGFLTSLASARSDIWLLDVIEPPNRWFDRILALFR